MKISKEELKQEIDELEISDDAKIKILEDIEDSVDIQDDTEKVEKSAYDELMAEYEDLKKKYKDRFLSGEKIEEKENEDIEEEQVIDIKEI